MKTKIAIATGDAAGIAFGSVGIVDPEADLEQLGDKVRQVRAFGGYAGWAGGQLEAECLVAEGDPKDSIWEQRVRETAHALMTLPEYTLA